MKKLLFAFAILFSTIMFSCGNTETSTKTIDSIDSIENVDTVIVDTIDVDTIA